MWMVCNLLKHIGETTALISLVENIKHILGYPKDLVLLVHVCSGNSVGQCSQVAKCTISDGSRLQIDR